MEGDQNKCLAYDLKAIHSSATVDNLIASTLITHDGFKKAITSKYVSRIRFISYG